MLPFQHHTLAQCHHLARSAKFPLNGQSVLEGLLRIGPLVQLQRILRPPWVVQRTCWR